MYNIPALHHDFVVNAEHASISLRIVDKVDPKNSLFGSNLRLHRCQVREAGHVSRVGDDDSSKEEDVDLLIQRIVDVFSSGSDEGGGRSNHASQSWGCSFQSLETIDMSPETKEDLQVQVKSNGYGSNNSSSNSSAIPLKTPKRRTWSLNFFGQKK